MCVCAGQDVHKSHRTEGAAQAVTRNKLIPTNRFVQVIYRHLDPSSCGSKRRHLPAPHTHTHTIFFSSSYYWTEREFINSECHSVHIFLCIGSLLLLLLLFLRCMPEQFERNQWGDWKKKKPKRQQQQLRCWPEIAEHSFRGEGVKKPTQVNTRSFKGKYCALLRTRKERERERVFWHPETAQNSALFPIRYVILSRVWQKGNHLRDSTTTRLRFRQIGIKSFGRIRRRSATWLDPKEILPWAPSQMKQTKKRTKEKR